ncbi:flagellar hook-length control protein FliK [Salinicola avicenniae]|uniref:flagellar hook-length control protein FliK n=1 Tax=Salinicola avicenniae TaxID=2916836 RepID=UPI0035B547B7
MEIADLLTRFPSEQSMSIRPAQPLMAQPPSSAEGLSSTLGQSVRESGVFYESHLSRWLGGDYPRAALLREPQAWLGLTFRPVSFEGGTPSGAPANALHAWGLLLARSRGGQQSMPLSPPPLARPPAERGGGLSVARMLPPLPLSPFEPGSSSSVVADRQGADASAMTRGHQLSQHPSDGLQSLVRHQLEMIASPGLRWEGEPWPGVSMVLSWSELDEEGRESDAEKRRESGEADTWQAQVTIQLPSLGPIEIDFRAVRDQPLRVALNVAETAVRDRLRSGLDVLLTRLQALDPEIDVRIEGEGGHG